MDKETIVNEDVIKNFNASAVEQVSPLEVKSKDLLKQVGDLKIADDIDLKQAVALKKDINAHTKAIATMRTDLTRPLDDLKKQVMDLEKQVAAPALSAKTALADKILAYEREVAERLRVEQERVMQLIASVTIVPKQNITLGDVVLLEAGLNKAYAGLNEQDRESIAIKNAYESSRNRLEQSRQDIKFQEEQAKANEAERERLQQEAEGRRLQNEKRERDLAEERRKEEARLKKQEASRPKTNTVTVYEYEIVDADRVPQQFCSPDIAKIRAAHKEGVKYIPGVAITEKKNVR